MNKNKAQKILNALKKKTEIDYCGLTEEEVVEIINNTNEQQEKAVLIEKREELTDIIYDTLMENTRFEQLDLDEVINPEVGSNIISFEWRGKRFHITIESN